MSANSAISKLQKHDTNSLKKDIIDEIGDISGIKLIGAQVLVGTFERPGKTAGGVLIPDSAKKEDQYQGKVGLVIALGPKAFDRDWQKAFGDSVPKIGDWVSFSVYESKMQNVNGKPCRMMRDDVIRSIVEHPELVY